VRHGERHRSHYGKIGGKPQPLRVAPADCGMVPAPRRSAAFELRHRSLLLGIRQRDLAGRLRETRLAAVAVEAAADYKPAVDERIQRKRASTVAPGKSNIFSFCNLASRANDDSSLRMTVDAVPHRPYTATRASASPRCQGRGLPEGREGHAGDVQQSRGGGEGINRNRACATISHVNPVCGIGGRVSDVRSCGSNA
jgi:hypothetical protein